MDRARAFNSRQAQLLSRVLLAVILLAGCKSPQAPGKPVLEITQVPIASLGGPTEMDSIAGRVSNTKPGEQIVLYAHSGVWWIQPLANQPYTKIQADFTWQNLTHLGTEYAAVLVEPGYRPASKLASMPADGNGVIAVTTVKGRTGVPVATAAIHFSGYDWIARSTVSDHGGEYNAYNPANAWTDDKGHLHLRMAERDGRWTCAEVSLNRSLGYGTYEFVVEDSAHLRPSAVLGMFTWDDMRSTNFRNELDIELSRWGDPKGKNAQYVVQPFFAAENLARFTAPPGMVTYLFRWEPGRASFETIRGDSAPASVPISEHVFTLSIPTPASETVHIDLYDLRHSENSSQQPAEAVIERFEFIPLSKDSDGATR
jgi:hypothetical protein